MKSIIWDGLIEEYKQLYDIMPHHKECIDSRIECRQKYTLEQSCETQREAWEDMVNDGYEGTLLEFYEQTIADDLREMVQNKFCTWCCEE